MALPVTVYRWDDDGAPQLSLAGNKPSDFLLVLKKCLVDGYGGKQSLGWSIPFESADGLAVVFRNSDNLGSGSFVQFEAQDHENTTGKPIYFKTAKLLTGVTTEWGGVSCKGFTGWIQPTIDKWILIGTSSGFYFFSSRSNYYDVMTMNRQTRPCFFMGDIDSFYNDDANRFISAINNHTSDKTSAGYNDGLGNIDKSIICEMHETDGSDNPKRMDVRTPFPSHIYQVNDTPNDIQFITSRVTVGVAGFNPSSSSSENMDSLGVKCMNSSLHPSARGILPGLLQSQFQGYSNTPFPVTRQIHGREHYLLPNTNRGTCGIWVDAEQWYD